MSCCQLRRGIDEQRRVEAFEVLESKQKSHDIGAEEENGFRFMLTSQLSTVSAPFSKFNITSSYKSSAQFVNFNLITSLIETVFSESS